MTMEHQEYPNVTVIAYDPGGTTGYAILIWNLAAILDRNLKLEEAIHRKKFGEITGSLYEQGHQLNELFFQYPAAAVVGEGFIVRQFNQSDDFLKPVEINAIAEYCLGAQSRRLIKQQPALAKSTISDDILRNYDMRHHNSPHARDASRHALTFARRASAVTKDGRKLRQQSWPHLFDGTV